jgi:hypothetical protein
MRWENLLSAGLVPQIQGCCVLPDTAAAPSPELLQGVCKEAQRPRACSAVLAHLRPEALRVQVELLRSSTAARARSNHNEPEDLNNA